MFESTNLQRDTVNLGPENAGLNFIWLELTSRCNLRCSHCYAESGPNPNQQDKLSTNDYFKLIDSAASLGCKKIQFIGGEPTIVRDLPELIKYAREKGFEFIEVFTNGISLPDKLLTCFVENKVSVALSFYSSNSEIHDSITRSSGSQRRTVKTIQRLLGAGINVRVGIISMKENSNDINQTIDYLKSLGVKNVGVDRIRSFGRANQLTGNRELEITELCGSCWQGSLCVFPDGKVAPCIMSRDWSIGSVIENELSKLVESPALKDLRTQIYERVWLPRSQNAKTNPTSIHKGSGQEADCVPDCVPTCNPQCSPNCSPCYPYGQCNPDLYCGPCNPSGR